VRPLTELLEDPRLEDRNMAVDVDHSKLGWIKIFDLPIELFDGEVGIGPGYCDCTSPYRGAQ